MNSLPSGRENVTIDWRGIPFPGIYRATRRRDGYHYCEIRFGMSKTRKYFHPDEVTFRREVKRVMVDKVGRYGQIPVG